MKTSNHFARPIAPPPCECDHTTPVLADRFVVCVLVAVAIALGALLWFGPDVRSVDCSSPPGVNDSVCRYK